MTGLATTHHTNATVYNPENEETARLTQEIIDDNQEESHPLRRRNVNDYRNYKQESLDHHQLQNVKLTILTVAN